ncbi:MAG: bifunctional UDP-sugar hydrolase/5'-nucleotidase [Anaerolineae bacterium]
MTETVTLTILHTNDMHGRVAALSRIVTLARQIRQEVTSQGSACVLWDAGDAEDTILLESSLTRGAAVMSLLAAAGYELQALGNASILRYGPRILPEHRARFGRPLLCANLVERSSGNLPAGLTPYTIVPCGDVRIGVIGLSAPIPVYTVFDLEPRQPQDVLPDLIAQVRAAGAQTIVLLSHLGSKADQQLAETIPGLDLIIGAHDHVALDPPLLVNSTLIAQAGDHGRFLGRLDLALDRHSGRIVSHTGRLLPISDALPPDPDFEQAWLAVQAEVKAQAARPVGELLAPLELVDDRECSAGNLLADALLARLPDVELALALAGQWTHGLPAGPVSYGGLNSAMRLSTNPGRVMLSGDEIHRWLASAVQPANAARKLHALRDRACGLPHVAGAQVFYDPAQPDSLIVSVGGEPLAPDRQVAVATTDLEFSEMIGYVVIDEARVAFEVPTIMAEMLEDYLALHWPLTPPTGPRMMAQATA